MECANYMKIRQNDVFVFIVYSILFSFCYFIGISIFLYNVLSISFLFIMDMTLLIILMISSRVCYILTVKALDYSLSVVELNPFVREFLATKSDRFKLNIMTGAAFAAVIYVCIYDYLYEYKFGLFLIYIIFGFGFGLGMIDLINDLLQYKILLYYKRNLIIF